MYYTISCSVQYNIYVVYMSVRAFGEGMKDGGGGEGDGEGGKV